MTFGAESECGAGLPQDGRKVHGLIQLGQLFLDLLQATGKFLRQMRVPAAIVRQSQARQREREKSNHTGNAAHVADTLAQTHRPREYGFPSIHHARCLIVN